MKIARIKKDVKKIVEDKNSARAFSFYKEVINHLRMKEEVGNWNEFTEAIHPLIELYNKGGKDCNYTVKQKKHKDPKPRKKKKKKRK